MLPTAKFSIDRPAPDVAVVAIEGDLDVYSAPDLRETHTGLINTSRYRQVFDLSGVRRIDSTGLGVIVGALKGCRAHGGELSLVVACEAADVAHALTITGLVKAIPTAETLDGALRLLEPKPEPQDERPSFWPPRQGDVWIGDLDLPWPSAFSCSQEGWFAGSMAERVWDEHGPLRLIWRDGESVTAMHSSELNQTT